MSLEFHDGSNKLYKGYTNGKAWDDVGLLRLNVASQYDKTLVDDYNTEAKIREMMTDGTLGGCYPFGVGKSKLSDFIGAEGTSIIIIKGLHQWQRLGKSWNYKLHLSFGLEGQLWHLNARYTNATQKITLTTECTAGEKMTGEHHDGFKVVGKGKKG